MHDRASLDWLIDHGADASRTDDSRDDNYPIRPFYPARNYSLKVLNLIAASGNIELFDHVVARGADPQRSMALHRASKCPDPEKAIAMIDHLLDKHQMNIETNNAEFCTHVDFVNSGTPLNCAVYHRNLAAVKHLLKRGAQPRDAADQSAGQDGAIPFLPALGPLLDASADPNDALEIVIHTHDIEAVRLCVKAGADPRAVISMQEILAARAARADLNSHDEGNHHDDEHPSSDDEKNAAWIDGMEALLRSFDLAS